MNSFYEDSYNRLEQQVSEAETLDQKKSVLYSIESVLYDFMDEHQRTKINRLGNEKEVFDHEALIDLPIEKQKSFQKLKSLHQRLEQEVRRKSYEKEIGESLGRILSYAAKEMKDAKGENR